MVDLLNSGRPPKEDYSKERERKKRRRKKPDIIVVVFWTPVSVSLTALTILTSLSLRFFPSLYLVSHEHALQLDNSTNTLYTLFTLFLILFFPHRHGTTSTSTTIIHDRPQKTHIGKAYINPIITPSSTKFFHFRHGFHVLPSHRPTDSPFTKRRCKQHGCQGFEQALRRPCYGSNKGHQRQRSLVLDPFRTHSR